MSHGKTVASGHFTIGLPSWGRCFWQDPNDGVLFLAYSSGDFEVDFVTSSDDGATWADPKVAFYIDDFAVHPNFDIAMDRNGELHCGFRFENWNCYSHLAKNGSTWDQEDPIHRPWALCADSGSVGGHNGSVYIHEVGDIYTVDTNSYTPPTWRATPIAFLVAKGQKAGGGKTAIHAAQVDSPFNTVPNSGVYNNEVSAHSTGIPPGLNGGFPLFTAAGSPSLLFGNVYNAQKQVTYTVDNTGICVAYTNSNTWTLRRAINIFNEGDPIADPMASGIIPLLLQGPTMGFEKGPYPFEPINSIILSTNEEELGGFFDKHWDLLTTAHEHSTDDGADKDKFVRVDSSAYIKNGVGAVNRSVNYDDWSDDVFNGGQPSNVAPALAPHSGTLCDITNGADSGIMYMYFNSRAPDGRHCVSRMLCEVEAQPQTGASTKPIATTYRFGKSFHPASGIRNFAHVDTTLAGGKDGKGMWNGMRALHHVNGQWAASKSEFVATVGSGLGPAISRLIAWNFNTSLEATASLKLPTFSFDHISASGNNTTFQGLALATIASSPADVHNLFDQDTSTAATISNGDSLTFEWNTPIILSRVEIPWEKTVFGSSNASNFFEVEIQTSMDGITFNTIKLYDFGAGREGFSVGNFLVKLFADHDSTEDTFAAPTRMDCGIGKFVRIIFGGSQTGTRSTREIRLYGASTTTTKTVTTFNSYDRTFSKAGTKIASAESFDGVYEFDSPPSAWRTSGDWDWFVAASGELSKRNRLPTAIATRDGSIHSGIFMGQTVGNGDGAALTTAEWMPMNSSGVVEIDINIGIDELDDNGNFGRTIKWDTRYHKIGRGVIIPPDSLDDTFQFFIAPTGAPASLNMGEVGDFHTQGSCFGSTCDYFTVTNNIPPGEWTLRWAFRRGPTINAIPILGDHSVAYIDNVYGLDAAPQPSIFGYLAGEAFATGIIHGYLAKTEWEYINAVTRGYQWFQPRHGYLQGAPNTESEVYSFLLGNTEADIYGYMLGGSGLLSIPSGSINGYMAVQSGDVSEIYGYALGTRAQQIYGMLTGTELATTPTGIYGYMMVPDAAETIYGGVNLGVSGVVTDSIEGFLANRRNEEVYGFVLGPSGTTSNIYGYMSEQKTGTIFGYVSALAEITGSINSYMMVADDEGNINGYLSASGIDTLVGTQQRINGYLLNGGVGENIYGYMNVVDSNLVNGYMNGVEFASGSINAWMSGVEFAQQDINGYLAGISGIASGNINSYLVGVDGPDTSIFGWIVGVPDSADSCVACTPDHGGVPLPPATLSLTIPSSCFNI